MISIFNDPFGTLKYGDKIQFYIIQFGEQRVFDGIFLAYSGDRLDALVEATEYGRTWVPIDQVSAR